VDGCRKLQSTIPEGRSENISTAKRGKMKLSALNFVLGENCSFVIIHSNDAASNPRPLITQTLHVTIRSMVLEVSDRMRNSHVKTNHLPGEFICCSRNFVRRGPARLSGSEMA
jgi:hypothetical protein